MVYKRYIKRGGKKFGPYYYESYRDEKGVSRTRRVDSPKKNSFVSSSEGTRSEVIQSFKVVYLLIGILILLSIFLIFPLNKGFKTSNLTGLVLAGSGTFGDPFNITTCIELQKMNNNLTAVYQLVNNTDCSDTVNWNSGLGFDPIGNLTDQFSGNFNGNNYNITGLFINRPSADNVGLFGLTLGSSVISNVGLIDVNITGNNYFGSLVARNTGNVTDSYSTGNINGNVGVGGLIGYNSLSGKINNSYSAGNINGVDSVGGLVGHNKGNVSNSYSTGNIISTGDFIGGLIGYHRGNLIDSYSTGNVNGSTSVGGLIGETYYGSVSNSYSTGNVNGSTSVGGLIGDTYYGSVSNSYSTGNVTVTGDFVGGLVGFNDVSNVSNSYSTGNINGNVGVGGLVGQNKDLAIINNSYSISLVNGNKYVGGLVGSNYGNVSNSYASGIINGSSRIGGLIGFTKGFVSNSYATGSVTGDSFFTGGFAGVINGNSGKVISSYSTGDVNGINFTGGFAGVLGNFSGSGEIINNSYTCSNVTGVDYTGGFVGGSNRSIYNSYSVGSVNGNNFTGGFIGLHAVPADYVSNFWDYETTGNYNDSGSSPYDLINVSANTTSVMTSQSTFINWDFAKVWDITEGVSYPFLQWQDNIACVAPLIISSPVETGGGGKKLTKDFIINKNLINITLLQGENKTETFVINNNGDVGLILSLKLSGLQDFATLSENSVVLSLGESKTIYINFSADDNSTLGTYNGKIEVFESSTETLDVFLKIIGEPQWILPIGTFPSDYSEPSEPIGSPLSSSDQKENPVFNFAKNGLDNLKETAEDFKDLSKTSKIIAGIAVIILWIVLLFLFLIYFIIRKYVKLKNQLAGHKSREDKIATINRLKKASRKANFFEKIVDKGALYLVGEKVKK